MLPSPVDSAESSSPVEPARTSLRRSATLGYATSESFIGAVDVEHDDLLGRGIELRAGALVSHRRRRFSVEAARVTVPNVPLLFGGELHSSLRVLPLFDRGGVGGSLSAALELTPALRVATTWRLEQLDLAPGGQVLLTRRAASTAFGSLGLSLEWDRRDERRRPSTGTFLFASLEWAPDLGFEAGEFLRARAGGRLFLRPARWLLARAIVSGGWLWSPPDNPVTVGELFYAGGRGSVRGYAPWSIGDLVLAGTAPGQPLRPVLIGGTRELVSSVELDAQLSAAWDVRAVFFVDAGAVSNEGGEGSGLLVGSGVALAVRTPLGPATVEFAKPLTPREGDAPFQLEVMVSVADLVGW